VALTHFPVSLFGTAFLFQILHLFMFQSGFEAATTVCLLVGAAFMIPVTVSGWFTWKQHYRGALTKIFRIKIYIGFVMLALSVALAIWRLSLYSIGRDTRPVEHYSFFFLCGVLIAGAVAEGYYGGRLTHH
jgi:uncharacterized membrane protein